MCVIKNIKSKHRLMKPITTKLLRFYLIADVGVLLLALFLGDEWLLNTQLAFLSSLFITFASFYSYQKMVQNRLESGHIPEDKFEHLYHDENDDDDDNDDKDTTKVSQHAPSSIKLSFKNLALSYKSAFSLYRLLAYGILFLVVLFLIRHERLDAIAFFVGLSVVPITSLITAQMGKKG